MLNLATLLEDSARRHPDRDAVVLGTTRLDYRSLDALANQVANLLVSRGVRPGDKVALSCPNTPQFPAVYYGILKAGAVVVPLNVMLKAREVAYHLTDAEAKAYFCFEGTPELPMGAEGWKGFQQAAGCDTFLAITAGAAPQHAPEGAELLTAALGEQPTSFDTVVREATDSAVILYTSGTTGHPKGAELSHANLVLNALTCNRQFGVVDHDVHLVTLPLFHSFGSTVQMNAGLGVGATLVLLPRFDAGQALALLEREKVTFFAGVPTMYWGLLGALARNADVDVAAIAARLRVAVSGGASLPVEIIREFEDRFGVQVLEGYGLSETSPLATFADPAHDPRPGSIGVPVWGVECRLVDEDWNTLEGADVVGEIAVKGHNVMKGYHNRPEATAEVMRDGWFRTGDLARRDEDGFYYIVDRAKDLIIRGGFNVYPREVEEVLMTHADVSLAAVIGVPHESHGEEVKAVVIPREGAAVTEDELLAWGKEQMAAYKYPRIVEFVDVLPMTATGKILKRELAARP